MRVLLISDSWPLEDKTLPPGDAASIVASAWGDSNPADAVVSIAVGDGGPRSADAVVGEVVSLGMVEAIVAGESWLLRPAGGGVRWDPRELGRALTDAVEHPERRGKTVVVPVGDADLAGDATTVWEESSEASRAAWSALPLEVLVTSQRPLLGLKGMSAAVRDGRESDQALAVASQEQEKRWSDIARSTDASQPRSLVGPARLSDVPGTGAASGLAYCLAAAGAKLTPASARLLDLVVPEGTTPDLVVAVTASLTPHTLDEGVSHAAAAIASTHGVPCAVLTVDAWVGKRDVMAAGVAAVHEGSRGADALAQHIARVAQTWSPQR
ncbi:glycerate kinase [Demequina flava]|uniref:glycerate kinase n=1 Tax=Demequina flava TaxID=1095025 RepID=UPI001364DC55|nr:glycerate kinase [Demequina flava]